MVNGTGVICPKHESFIIFREECALHVCIATQRRARRDELRVGRVNFAFRLTKLSPVSG